MKKKDKSTGHNGSESDTHEPPVVIEVPLSAPTAFRLFCKVDRTPEWMGGEIRSAKVTEFGEDGFPLEAVYMASMKRGGLVYKVRYEYRMELHEITWESSDLNVRRIEGFARFSPIDENRCQMTYRSVAWVGDNVSPWLGERYKDRPEQQLAESFRDWAVKIAAE